MEKSIWRFRRGIVSDEDKNQSERSVSPPHCKQIVGALTRLLIEHFWCRLNLDSHGIPPSENMSFPPASFLRSDRSGIRRSRSVPTKNGRLRYSCSGCFHEHVLAATLDIENQSMYGDSQRHMYIINRAQTC